MYRSGCSFHIFACCRQDQAGSGIPRGHMQNNVSLVDERGFAMLQVDHLKPAAKTCKAAAKTIYIDVGRYLDFVSTWRKDPTLKYISIINY